MYLTKTHASRSFAPVAAPASEQLILAWEWYTPPEALWPKHESNEGPSFVKASDPSGFERWLKNWPPVTARPVTPMPVSTGLAALAGFRGICMYCHLSHRVLGMVTSWSCSASWSGTPDDTITRIPLYSNSL